MSRKAAIKVLALVVGICVITASVFVVQKLMKRTTSFSRLGVKDFLDCPPTAPSFCH